MCPDHTGPPPPSPPLGGAESGGARLARGAGAESQRGCGDTEMADEIDWLDLPGRWTYGVDRGGRIFFIKYVGLFLAAPPSHPTPFHFFL